MGDLEQTRIVWEIIREILTSLSAIVVAFSAKKGLSTWKKQMVGKDSFDVAKRVLCAVYDLRTAINYVRRPFHLSDEVTLAKETILNKDSTTREGLTDYKIQEALYSIRWEKINTASNTLYMALQEAEALWGAEFVNITNPLWTVVNKLHRSIDSYLMSLQYPENFTEENRQEYKSVMLSKSWNPSKDEFNKELEESIKKIEDYLRPQFITPKY